MQRKSTLSLRLKTTARQQRRNAARLTGGACAHTTRDWRVRIVERLVREQPARACLNRPGGAKPRYRRRSWWMDTSPPAQSRRAVQRWHGCAQDLWTRNVAIAAWCSLGATQAHVGAKYGLTRQRVGQIVRQFPWVREAVRETLTPHGEEGGKCQSSLRGGWGSGSWTLERDIRCSCGFRPLSRPERTRWRRICDRRGSGSRRRQKGSGSGGRLAALAAASLASTGSFRSPQQGGKCQFRTGPNRGESASSGPDRAGGKVPVPDLSEIRRRWQLRGGARWRQRGFAFLGTVKPPGLEATGKFRRQGRLW